MTADAGLAAQRQLFSTSPRPRRTWGDLIDGLVRDRTPIHVLGDSVYGAGVCRTCGFRTVSIKESSAPTRCGGVQMTRGERVAADDGGPVWVPSGHAAYEAEATLRKTPSEHKAREGLTLQLRRPRRRSKRTQATVQALTDQS